MCGGQIRAGSGSNGDGWIGLRACRPCKRWESGSRHITTVNMVMVVETRVPHSDFDILKMRSAVTSNYTSKFPGVAVRLTGMKERVEAAEGSYAVRPPPSGIVIEADPIPKMTPELFCPIKVLPELERRPRRRRKRGVISAKAGVKSGVVKAIVPGPTSATHAAAALYALAEQSIAPYAAGFQE